MFLSFWVEVFTEVSGKPFAKTFRVVLCYGCTKFTALKRALKLLVLVIPGTPSDYSRSQLNGTLESSRLHARKMAFRIA